MNRICSATDRLGSRRAKMKVKFDSNVQIKNENDLLLRTDKVVLTDKEEVLHIKTEDAKANAVTIKENHIE